MGYLDHSTNNIILDAVLTDYGRSQLALGGSNFEIAKFAFGDDEVDYTIIKKYGRTVGKEKIEKNTPIFEALTNENIALKFPLIGISNNATLRTVRLPVMSATVTPIVLGQATSNSGNATSITTAPVNITVRYKGNTADPATLQTDFASTLTKFDITVSGRFLSVGNNGGGAVPLVSSSPTDANRTERYKLSYTSSSTVTFSLTSKTIDATTLQIYGQRISSTQRRITTYVKVTNELGTTLEIPVTYTALG